MKKNVLFVLSMFAVIIGSAQKSIPQDPMLRLIQASRIPLMSDHSEVIRIEETNWERLYGESEFTLTPTVKDIGNYFLSVYELAKNQGNIQFSRLSYFNVEINEFSRKLLIEFGIKVPDYFNGSYLKVLLPVCHFNELKQEKVNIQFDLSYGNSQLSEDFEENEQVEVVFYSEGFEVATVPGNLFSSSTVGNANCGWGDESCQSYTGDWSVWCSGNGAGCNDCSTGGYHVNDVTSVFAPTSWIDVSGYSNKILSYMIWSDLNDFDLTDVVVRYYAFNGASSWSISGDSFTSASSLDETGWTYRSASITGGSTYIYGFAFASDGSFASDGTYIDDIKMSGTAITDVDELVAVSSIIYPNPAKNFVNVKSNEMPSRTDILDINGRLVMTSYMQRQIDITPLPSGLYTIRVFLNNNIITEKFIIE